MKRRRDEAVPPRTVGFWSSEVICERCPAENVISDFTEKRVDHASYRLTVGEEVYISPTSDEVDPQYKTKRCLSDRQSVAIPSGQFAILTTAEDVDIPDDTIAFISVRSKEAKFRGLVNVSGFHVDPGYKGRLIFTVFNAGPGPVHVARGDEWFMISFVGLDRRSAKLRPENEGFSGIPSEIISPISGQFLTLKGLDSKIDDSHDELVERLHGIEREHTVTRWAAVFVLTALVALGVRQCTDQARAADRMTMLEQPLVD